MRKGVIKKVAMIGSLGLALFFSGQALAGIDQIFIICAKDATTGNRIVIDIGASEGVILPKELDTGQPCGTFSWSENNYQPINHCFAEERLATLYKKKIYGWSIRQLYAKCSGQAQADNGQILIICAQDQKTEDYYIYKIAATKGTKRPPDRRGQPCDDDGLSEYLESMRYKFLPRCFAKANLAKLNEKKYPSKLGKIHRVLYQQCPKK